MGTSRGGGWKGIKGVFGGCFWFVLKVLEVSLFDGIRRFIVIDIWFYFSDLGKFL